MVMRDTTVPMRDVWHRQRGLAMKVPAESPHRRPVGTRRWQGRGKLLEAAVAMDDFAADHRQNGLKVLDFFFGNRESAHSAVPPASRLGCRSDPGE